VFLADDHAVVRVGLKAILADDPRLVVVGEAGTGEECLRLVPKVKPAVVLLDLRLPDLPGFEVCRRIKCLPEPPAVLILTSFTDDHLVLESISAGADGYLLKDFEQTELGSAIVRVANGSSILDPAIARKVMDASRRGGLDVPAQGAISRLARLSPQEQRILKLISEGRTNKEIATALRLGDGTVRNYLTSVFTKLEVQNRTEAVALWLKHQSGTIPMHARHHSDTSP
jgi:DNA-binding NarL/FixJ family response regulator